MKRIDLHVHTNVSDGTTSPAETVRLAKEAGLAAIAVTDHDTYLAYAQAALAGMDCGIEVVPGIEISTKYGVSVHILGYYIDSSSKAMRSVLDWVVDDRNTRNRKMCELLQADGIDITYEQMQERFGRVIGRPHFAELLVSMGYASSINDAFDKYVEKGRKYYVARNILPIEKAVGLIAEAGGVPVLAHPFQYKKSDSELRELIEHCMPYGLAGMECRYSGYDAEKVAYLEALAKEYGLVKTGGSDYHGEHKKHISLGTGIGGNLEVPYEYLEILREKAGEM